MLQSNTYNYVKYNSLYCFWLWTQIDDDLMSYVLELPCGMYFGSDIELCSPDYQIGAQKRPRKETDPDSSAVISDTPKNKLQKRDCKETAAHEEVRINFLMWNILKNNLVMKVLYFILE